MKLRIRYRQRCYLLLTVGVLLLAVLWEQRLSGSLRLWQARDALADRLAGPDDRADRMAALRAQLASMDAAMGDPDRPADEVWRSALTYATDQKEGARLRQVEEEVVTKAGEKSRHVFPMTMEGGFAPLLRMANGLQQNVREAHVASLRFHIEREPMTRKRLLLMTLYLQKIANDHG
jgi:hypothetical protein